MIVTPSDPDIQTIVARIKSGDLDLQPDFQRGEVWPLIKKKKLIDSILRRWHIPPIHVVVSSGGFQEVLDGQQRLVSIRDFVRGEFTVDGSLEPLDPEIQALDGLKYSDLPHSHRRAFDQYSLRVFRLTEFSPEEPGELFFRLNQITALTSAEQRNAFIGPVRDQVRRLVKYFERIDNAQLVGFTNRRMALDDVIAKLLFSLESKSLATKLTANTISNRFRSKDPFSDSAYQFAERCIATFVQISLPNRNVMTFNKATLFSWLAFLVPFLKDDDLSVEVIGGLADYQRSFEIARANDRASGLFSTTDHHITSLPLLTERALLDLYTDRASFRVSDVSSVVARDAALWLVYLSFKGRHGVQSSFSRPKFEFSRSKQSLLTHLQDRIRDLSAGPFDVIFDDSIDQKIWGDLG